MAKELPYFKFDCSEWISGNITLEDFQTQGVFINICAYYWFKSGCLKTSEIKPRLKCKQSVLDRLFEAGHLKADGDFVKISFLDEQFAERGHVSAKNSFNGSLGGAPKGNKNAQKNKQAVDLEQPKTTNIEENRIRTEENRGEEKENCIFFGSGDSDFILIPPKYANEKWKKIIGGAGLAEFYQANMSSIKNPELTEKFLREKCGSHFEDFKHVHNTFIKFSTPNGNGKPNTNSAEVIIGKKQFAGKL